MTTSRQQTANRENARASTGPRTPASQARAKRNARRHGLAARNRLSGGLANEVKALTHQIAGSDPNSAVLTAAGRIAEAQIDWQSNCGRWIVMSGVRSRAASAQLRIWTQSGSSKPRSNTSRS
jgi:hypothetical protein